ncbi:hypothetical protein [Pseudacidovorax sp. RU35E]|uniref:hypothetical protein n=1 Tax=Pseudacidovorax sp. RU35E TaxID=1907403 RepID=UPI000954ECF5|nr:hypothetical protein [Pseudacidovorax sp. RU35E]SIQ99508.1 hypothetical protein SAMN05880557_10767 [Pseudacidovorax sp. RU35E]
MKHRLFVNVAMCICFYALARFASAATFAQEVYMWDYESLVTAAVGGLFGGVFKTIFTLANDNRAVFLVLKESRRDLVTALLAGLAVYVLMIMVESKWPGTVTRELRFGGVLIAGWMGNAFFTWVRTLAKAKLDQQAGRLRAGVPLDEPPSSAVVPLADNPPPTASTIKEG